MCASRLKPAADPRRAQCLLAATDYRDLLRYELAARSARNIGYSLRAFARDLRVSPSTLSELFNGKHDLSLRTARGVADTLGLSSDEQAVFLDLVALAHTEEESARTALHTRLDAKRERLAANGGSGPFEASTIDWRELALLALVKAKGAQVSPEEMVRRFGWGERECQTLVDRLVAAGILSRNGEDLRTSADERSGDGTNLALARSALARVQAAIDTHELSPADHYQTSAVAVHDTRLGDVNKLIASMFEEIRALASSTCDGSSVILVSTQCLKLDRDG